MLPSIIKSCSRACRTSVRIQAAKYTDTKIKFEDISDVMNDTPLDLGKFKDVGHSLLVDKYEALNKEITALIKQDKTLPILDPDAQKAFNEMDAKSDKKEMEELLSSLVDPEKEFVEKPRNPDAHKRAIDVFIKQYEKVYAALSVMFSEKQFPQEFYSLPPSLQQAWRDYRKENEALRKQLFDKYGDKILPVYNRTEVLDNLFTGIVFPSVFPSEPIHVAITGACGQIGYSLAFRIASGGLFGQGIPIVLHLLELPQAMDNLRGVVMELQDCAFPCLNGIIATDSPERAFEGVDWALLVGASPRTKGMERGDLLLKNAEIFSIQGKALNISAKRENTRVVVVGNPANTNALIAQQNAPNIPAENFSAMTRLDHNRGLAQLSAKLGVHVDDIDRFVIWGNHSATQFPDVSYATVPVSLSTGIPIPGNRPGIRPDNLGIRLVTDLLDEEFLNKTFIPKVQKRGAEIIDARGSSSAQSAASALIDSVHEWEYGTHAAWTSAAVISNGEYGVEKGLFFSYPLVFSEKNWDIVRHLPIDEYQASLLEKTHQELIQERDAVLKFLPGTSAKFTKSEGDEHVMDGGNLLQQ